MNEEALADHAADRLRDVLQPHAQHAVDEGRDVRATGWRSAHILIDCDEDTVLRQGRAAGRRQRVPHRRAHLLLLGAAFEHSVRRSNDAQARHPEGLAAGRDRPAVRARGLQHLRQLALVLPGDRRPGDRVHADSRAGDGALRGRRRARRGPDRPGLDRRARGWRTAATDALVPIADLDLREAELRQGALGAGRAGGLARPDAGGSRGRDDRHRAGARHASVLRAARRQRRTSSSRGAPPR